MVSLCVHLVPLWSGILSEWNLHRPVHAFTTAGSLHSVFPFVPGKLFPWIRLSLLTFTVFPSPLPPRSLSLRGGVWCEHPIESWPLHSLVMHLGVSVFLANYCKYPKCEQLYLFDPDLSFSLPTYCNYLKSLKIYLFANWVIIFVAGGSYTWFLLKHQVILLCIRAEYIQEEKKKTTLKIK